MFLRGFFIDCCFTSCRWLLDAFLWIWLERTILIFYSILMSRICLSRTSYALAGSFRLLRSRFSLAFSICFRSRTPVIFRISLVSQIRPFWSLSEPSWSSISHLSRSEPELGSHSTLGPSSYVSPSASSLLYNRLSYKSNELARFFNGLFRKKTPKTLSASSRSCLICSIDDSYSSWLGFRSRSSAFFPFLFALERLAEPGLRGTEREYVYVRSLGMILLNSRWAISLNFRCLISILSRVSRMWLIWDSILLRSRSRRFFDFW